MDDDMAPDAQVHSSDDEDIRNAHIPKVNLRQGWWKLLDEDRPATPEHAWSIPSFDVPVPKNNWASSLTTTYSPPLEDSLLAQTSDMATPALSISKMKSAYYPDVGLEKMVPDQMWIEEECKAIRTHMRILSVVGIEVFSMYGHGARLYILENLDIPQQVSKAVDEIVTDAVDWAIESLLRNCFRDLPKANIKEILHQRSWETNSYKTHEDHMILYEALKKSMNRDNSEDLLKDLVEPPPPPPLAGPSGTSGSPRASGSSQLPPPPPLPPSTN
nr:hypothetical protein [Tanacetum cinerariifolium]